MMTSAVVKERHDERTWTTTSAAAVVKHDEKTRVAAEEKHDEKKSTAAAATANEQDETTSVAAVKKWDEEMNIAAAKQCDGMMSMNEEANMNAVGHREVQGAINLLSFRTDAAITATEKRMNLGGSLEVTVKPEGSQRRMVIETRPVRELNTLKGEMGETTEGFQTGGWAEREMRGDWGSFVWPRVLFGVWSETFRVWVFDRKLRKQAGETAAGGRERGREKRGK